MWTEAHVSSSSAVLLNFSKLQNFGNWRPPVAKSKVCRKWKPIKLNDRCSIFNWSKLIRPAHLQNVTPVVTGGECLASPRALPTLPFAKRRIKMHRGYISSHTLVKTACQGLFPLGAMWSGIKLCQQFRRMIDGIQALNCRSHGVSTLPQWGPLVPTRPCVYTRKGPRPCYLNRTISGSLTAREPGCRTLITCHNLMQPVTKPLKTMFDLYKYMVYKLFYVF